jgi:hypothetical protein
MKGRSGRSLASNPVQLWTAIVRCTKDCTLIMSTTTALTTLMLRVPKNEGYLKPEEGGPRGKENRRLPETRK